MEFEKNKRRNILKGFSFIEVMLSVFLLSVGIITVISTIVAGMNNTTESRRYFIASLLSQEGVELVRNIRDNNAKSGDDSFLGITDGSRIIGAFDNNLYSVSGENTRLYLLSGYYRHVSSGDSTPFSRKIIIETQGDSKLVTSVVVWDDGEFPTNPDTGNCNLRRKCTFTEIILNKWREGQ